ncbi:MAG: ABC transporter ATP-binding protein/permease [Proteobacteria bacterium]|nr:ABC transporter ATP-binding protein/permease [Pseudomonadota bacterium]MBU1451095.1 ABC transporter ATP-binding protein/permease [Pseudomonadota bacterium]MBU2517829.1 ABC transporter ATP-binding protein/permease [Pseudomonadota bacterium]
MSFPADYGYMEGDQLGKPYDVRLLKRLASYGRPHLAVILFASLLTLMATGLELTLPYITRLAIDRYMVRQALEVRPQAAPPELVRALRQEAGAEFLPGRGQAVFVPETAWRKLDHKLTARLRAAGAVGEHPFYLAPPTPEADRLARLHPELFVKAGERWVVATPDLARLPGEELRALRAPDAWGMARLALLFLLAAAGVFGLGYFQTMLLERTGQEMMLAMRQQLYRHLLGRDEFFFSRNPVGKLVTRLTNDIQNLNEMFTSALVSLFQDVFVIVGIVVVLLWLDFKLALVCLALTPVVGGLAWAFSRLARDAFRRLQGHLGRINSWLGETLDGLAVIKLFRAEGAGQKQFRRLNDGYFDAGMRQVKVFAVFLPITELLSALAMALIIYYGGGRVVQDQLSLGTLVAFLSYMQMFFRPVRDLAEKYNIMQAAMASGERIFHLLDDPQALPAPRTPAPAQAGPGRVEFRGVTFGYEPGRPVVRDLNLVIPPGESWAVVGPTGAGKTSLVNLLMRLYDPDQGSVLIDGVDLRDMDRKDVAKRVAMVSQEVFLLSGTVKENITLNRPEVDQEHLERALEVSGAAEFVGHLEHGLDTQLGEGARRLSAGQRQLLALARAVAGDPRVLVLDEATSSVDPVSERLIQKSLPRVMAGRTSLVVAHRLSTIRRADNILVMHQGRVVEQGRHQELMDADGLYARLVRLQRLKNKEDHHANGD